jgi:hypothetical protein
MTKYSFIVLTGSVLGSFYFSTVASACSLVNFSQDDLKSVMIPKIAKVAQVAESDIQPSDLTDAKLDFLVPLGGDCSGLYGAYHASAFKFTLGQGRVSCTYTGLAIIMGYGLDRPVSVQARRECRFS